jgi:hypothetical protein
VVTEETVETLPVESVTAVEVENVADVTADVAVMLPAVADTSAAAVSATGKSLAWAFSSAPYWTEYAGVVPAELNARANSAEEIWAPNGVYVAPEPSVATRFVHPVGAPHVVPVVLAVLPTQLMSHIKAAPTGAENV